MIVVVVGVEPIHDAEIDNDSVTNTGVHLAANHNNYTVVAANWNEMTMRILEGVVVVAVNLFLAKSVLQTSCLIVENKMTTAPENPDLV